MRDLWALFCAHQSETALVAALMADVTIVASLMVG